ncbi:MAG TPA: Crp/Fnr family transcriptional regulator [Streptosporangiaceae bacterium]|nr:Crp/Fnr family transcriptional regulator [Streptosporangiaceae bacterium]
MTEQMSVLGAQPFLRTLPADSITRLAETARHISVPAGHRLFDEDSPARKFWIIDAGQVALDALVPGVGRVVIERLGRGDVVGLSWLEPPYQFRYGAITTQPMQAYEFDAVAVRAACEQEPALGYALLNRFMAIALHRLQATRARLLEARSPAMSARLS